MLAKDEETFWDLRIDCLELVLETEVNGQIVTVDWELEGSAEYFEGETVYKNGGTV